MDGIGTVVQIDPGGAFGFLKSDRGHEIYFNCISILVLIFSVTVTLLVTVLTFLLVSRLIGRPEAN
ncbi:hypothetical protein ACVWW6_008851 [Bradyrhizobium sp. USDA 3311]|uniref:hypothetical protein n=1 Tax=unclassified Bradyrhizobium TaxID=2631580 RepID=UPI0013740584|nr:MULTISPECIES: hypothetical protein [unclassified Bradyrhizobium]MDA9503810.1 hypothetical protein [Bradyrhizobium sp. CCBAU 11386]QHP73123.1 hypothetical protein EI171_41285 [Bradyrhizobium sp. LCT2]